MPTHLVLPVCILWCCLEVTRKWLTVSQSLMLLNWWQRMPLLVVSPKFLKDCGDQVQVYFLRDPITEDNPDVLWKPMLIAESEFVDGGENNATPDCAWMTRDSRDTGDYCSYCHCKVIHINFSIDNYARTKPSSA